MLAFLVTLCALAPEDSGVGATPSSSTPASGVPAIGNASTPASVKAKIDAEAAAKAKADYDAAVTSSPATVSAKILDVAELPKLDRSKGAKFTIEAENPLTGFTEILPDPHPLANPDINPLQAHWITVRQGHEKSVFQGSATCDICGFDEKTHQKYFPEKNYITDDKGTKTPRGVRVVSMIELQELAQALPKPKPKDGPAKVIDL